ncbi:1999_t:CDS:2 [Diversispora eburnea]|uniref:1999_t:CDS:1 n=1 Tax=Diversispora eburnea TaxID=1213867 RepID=A0A9N9CQA7_9GLOM|nr:1999_t:CDS:2 [Diversispora eburnea]
MSLYTGNSNTSFSSFSSFSSTSSVATEDSTDVVPKKMSDCITLEDYEECVEEFNIHRCWEWSNGEVIIYELPSISHEVVIGAVTRMLLYQCNAVAFTDAEINSLSATRICDRNCGIILSNKTAVIVSNGYDGNDLPWPNLVVEVTYTKTLAHVEETLCYWLSPGLAHDCIIVSIDPILQGQVPVRMRVWHYCVSAGRGTRNIFPLVTTFEFGTQDGTGTATNINQSQCIINISLSCLYHELKLPTQIPQNLPDPITLDFYFAQRVIT